MVTSGNVTKKSTHTTPFSPPLWLLKISTKNDVCKKNGGKLSGLGFRRRQMCVSLHIQQ